MWVGVIVPFLIPNLRGLRARCNTQVAHPPQPVQAPPGAPTDCLTLMHSPVFCPFMTMLPFILGLHPVCYVTRKDVTASFLFPHLLTTRIALFGTN